MHAARARRAELLEVGDGLGAALLRKADQAEQDLRRRLGVGQRAVARAHARAEEPRERGEAGPRGAAREQPPREPDRVDHRCGDPPARSAARSRGRGTRGRSARCGRRGRSRRRRRGTAAPLPARVAQPELPVVDPGQRADRGREPHARVRERLERRGELERLHPDGADLADARASPARARSSRGRRRRSGRARAGVLSAAGSASATRSPRHASRESARTASSSSPRASAVGEPPEREEPPRGLLGGHRPAPLLDELDEPVGRVQAKLHGEPL